MRLTPEKKRVLFSCLTPLKFARSPIEGRGDRACIIPKAMPRFAILLGCCACSLRVLALSTLPPSVLGSRKESSRGVLQPWVAAHGDSRVDSELGCGGEGTPLWGALASCGP